MISFYRYSDKGKDPQEFSHKFSKKDCWNSFYEHFSSEKIIVVCDNCDKKSIDYFKSFKLDVLETNLGNSAGGIFTYEYALKNFPDEKYYFCEDDYIHRGEKLPKLIEEVLKYTDYCSLYDHGDKYRNYNSKPNPLLRSLGESTELFRTSLSHWKLTNSTTMTFATKHSVLREDIEIFKKYTTMNIPRDFEMFIELNKKGRSLATPIPSKSTHLSPDHDNLAPFFKL